ncbi:Crp/Fnr family transcriptional regulator [Spirochaeta dissipatitropha]
MNICVTGVRSTREYHAQAGHCCARCFFRCSPSAESSRMISSNRVDINKDRGQYLFHTGDQPSGIWVICKGTIKVFQETEEGKQLTLRILGPGDIVGYQSLLAGHPFSHSGIALEDTRITFLPAGVIKSLIASDPLVRDAIIHLLAVEVDHAEQLATRMAYCSSGQRLISAFREMCSKTNGCDMHEPMEITAPRQELAELAGMTVEATVRTLRRLEDAGIVKAHGRKILILDPLRLAEDAASF